MYCAFNWEDCQSIRNIVTNTKVNTPLPAWFLMVCSLSHSVTAAFQHLKFIVARTYI